MPDGTPPIARQLERGRSNRFLAILPPHDFALLRPHLRTVTLERGVMLQEAAGEIERVYFPHSGMVSLVAVFERGTISLRWGCHRSPAAIPLASVAERDRRSRQQNGSTVMPRFYFHIDDDRTHIDRVGVELADLETARDEAVSAAGQILGGSGNKRL
jgi:hypothetical protein